MYVIANPAAGRGRVRKALEQVRSLLGPEDELVTSRGPGDSERLAAEGAAAGAATSAPRSASAWAPPSPGWRRARRTRPTGRL